MHRVEQGKRDRQGASLRGDQRGAILVVGIALGVVLIAAIAELVAVGSAVRAREAAQAAADASALENAVWHARGMNTVAALNLVMGTAVGVLVLWRLVLAASALASLAALVALPLGATPAPPSSVSAPSSLAGLLAANAGVEDRVRWMLTGLGAAQAAVAAYTPRLAARGATRFAGSGERRVETFSASGWVASGWVASADTAPRVASPASLPLEVERASLLCAQPSQGWEGRASAAVEGLLRSDATAAARQPVGPHVLSALGIRQRGSPIAITARLAGLADDLAPGVFCSEAGPALDGLAALGRELAAAERRTAASSGTPPLQAALRHGSSAAPLATPTRVWAPARNGNVYLRSAALLSIPAPASSAAPSGVVAHAEMYFDCTASWQRCAPDAAWQPRWRARLRQVRPLSELLAAAGDDARAWQPGRALPPAASDAAAARFIH